MDVLERLRGTPYYDKVLHCKLAISQDQYLLSYSDESFRHYIRKSLADDITNVVMKKATFTQIKTPEGDVDVIGRCVVLSLEEFVDIISRHR